MADIDTTLASIVALPCDPLVAEAIAYWQRIRPSDGLLPGRRHFDPVEIPRLLPYIGLLDVVREPYIRVKGRMGGSKLTEVYGTGLVGSFFDEVIPDFDDSRAAKDYRQVVADGVPSWYRGAQSVKRGKSFLGIERILLPLAEDGRAVDMILAVYLFFYSDGQRY